MAKDNILYGNDAAQYVLYDMVRHNRVGYTPQHVYITVQYDVIDNQCKVKLQTVLATVLQGLRSLKQPTTVGSLTAIVLT